MKSGARVPRGSGVLGYSGQCSVVDRRGKVIRFSKSQLAPEDVIAPSFARILEDAEDTWS